LQEARRIHLGAHSGGRAGNENVARTQREHGADAFDEPGDVDDHVAGVAVLAQLVVDPHPYPQVLRVGDLVGRQQATVRTGWSRRIPWPVPSADASRLAGRQDLVARGHVLDVHVPGDVLHRVSRGRCADRPVPITAPISAS